MTISPTGDLDPATIARFRERDSWFDFDRHQAGLPELVACGNCLDGIAQRVVDDYAPDSGLSYAAVNGSARDPRDSSCWLCPACAAVEAA